MEKKKSGEDQSHTPAGGDALRKEVEENFAAWAEDPAASASERRERLDRAEESLNQAKRLVATLESASFRRFLRFKLNACATELQEAQDELGSLSARIEQPLERSIP